MTSPNLPGNPGDETGPNLTGPSESDVLLVAEPVSAVLTGGTGKEPKPEKPASLWSDAWRELRRNPLFIIGGLLILLLVTIAAFPQWFTAVDALDTQHCKLNQAREAIGVSTPLGRDTLGCDVYSRAIYGTQNSILVGLFTALATALVGGTLGMFAGYFGGWLDTVLSRVTEVFFALPLVLGGLLILSVVPTVNIFTVTLALTVVAWPMTFRIMRAAVVTAKSQDYVVAARALGAGNGRIMLRHILPNAVAPVIVVGTINLGVYIAAEAALSYLGIGLRFPDISWGLMISDAQPWFLQAAHPLFVPAAFLSITVLSFIMLGDAVRDALDPKLR